MSLAYQTVDGLNEELVARAEDIIRAMGQQSAGELGELSKAQLSRAIAVARSARSFRVFDNWLAYQAAREQSGSFWTHKAGERSLLEWVRETMSFIEERTRRLAGDDQSLQQEMATEALVRFLGFLRRALVGSKYLREWGCGR